MKLLVRIKIILAVLTMMSLCIIALHTHSDISEADHCGICAIIQNASAGHSPVCVSFILFVVYVSLSAVQKYRITLTSSKLSRSPPLFL